MSNNLFPTTVIGTLPRPAWIRELILDRKDGRISEEDADGVLDRAIESAMRGRADVLDDPILSLGELKSLVRRSDLLLGNDTGPRHIAKAFGVPVVSVFGPTFPEWTATSYEAERILRIDVDCGPCHKRVCPFGHLKCMTGVSVETVTGAVGELLDRP